MLFGQSVFHSVLERLQAESVAGDAAEPPAHRIRGLPTGFVAGTPDGGAAGLWQLQQSYGDLDLDEPVPPPAPAAAPVMPPHLARTAPQDVAAELDLSEKDTLQTLNDKRRRFAKANHPDGIALPFRDKATVRMTIANLLIDEATRRLGRQA